jgi:hypothetical protein
VGASRAAFAYVFSGFLSFAAAAFRGGRRSLNPSSLGVLRAPCGESRSSLATRHLPLTTSSAKPSGVAASTPELIFPLRKGVNP